MKIRQSKAKQATKSPCYDASNIQHKCADVFQGVGKLPSQYHIEIDRDVNPVVHAPVALRDKLKHELREMVNDDIIAPVSYPKEMRICMDPWNINRPIRREHCQMPTIEEIATRLSGARVFTVVDTQKLVLAGRIGR